MSIGKRVGQVLKFVKTCFPFLLLALNEKLNKAAGQRGSSLFTAAMKFSRVDFLNVIFLVQWPATGSGNEYALIQSVTHVLILCFVVPSRCLSVLAFFIIIYIHCDGCVT